MGLVEILFHPKVFNHVIMGLYVANAGYHAYQGKYAGTCYWLSALAITATVTWGDLK